ncbi:hypothetical protein E4P34_06720 [Kocuria rhizophila]|uniref:Uncharacterized protein n=1 Tax=Kocuria rhizophila TaxID=72000 RepID=A0AAX2SC01_KOCRH|nr:hypothetical protein [Kocuria rhizophila]TFH99669.1 hypothetical protein E4P33_10295 [Kocuria rhizophila]TFI07756.1 hypothetical protein E4P34_06720 [Kocuria rhizophila]
MGSPNPSTLNTPAGTRLNKAGAADPNCTAVGFVTGGAHVIRSVEHESKTHQRHKDVMDMNFTDMLTEIIENETSDLEGVEIVSTAPDGIAAGEGLISG